MDAVLRMDRGVFASAGQATHLGEVRTCFGIGCPSRQTCLRYHAVDTAPSQTTSQVTCAGRNSPEQGRYPDYIPIGVICLSAIEQW
jgi:hypothetical protein